MGERWRGRGTSESDDIYGVKGPPVFFPEAGEVLFQSLVVGVGGFFGEDDHYGEG